MKKITYIKKLSFFIALFGVVTFGFGQIVAWEMNTNLGNEVTIPATTLAANLNTSTIIRGTGISASALANAFSSNNYTVGGTQASSIIDNEYLQFQVSATSGYQVSLSILDVNFRRSGTGPSEFIWRYSIDGVNFTDIGTSISYTTIPINGTAQTQIDLSVIPALQNVASGTIITFRLYGWAASGSAGSFAIGRLAGNDLSIGGTIDPICATSTTYSAIGGWSNGFPNSLTKEVIINNSYNTSAGNITACSLTVTNNAILTVADNTFVEVQNHIIVDAGSEFNVQPYAAVVQISNSGIVTNNGTMSVAKKTAPANAWYEYTYWSSPVKNADIENGLAESNIYRRFSFNAQNFLDATMEIGNNNATIPGQDDVDDNGDDWVGLSGATKMQPGVGYAATHDPVIFSFTPGNQIDYVFDGEFNNGIITVPVYRNDGSTLDKNWNLIGNPYPSAISVASFFTQNKYDVTTNPSGTLEGAIYYWSQNTPPSNATNGNETSNFSNDDYAIFNGTGGSAGGDLLTPNEYIPSGQGFFISFAEARPTNTGNVIFNNAMRVKGTTDNSQFFKNSNSKEKSNTIITNKLWLNVVSDTGLFNQILVGYVDGASNADDGEYFDAFKIATYNTPISFYSIIEGSNKKFAIQGKDINSLNESETIKLGFKSTVNVATLFKLSISDLQGDFLNSNTIYLKDNLLDKKHNLSASDYTFTSAFGEFNDRFVITFSNQALAIEDVLLNKNTLNIVQLNNEDVQFKTSNNLTIKTVSIFDMLGRQLYSFKGENNQETFKLSNLNNSVFIAKVTLSNGAVISKKAFKK